MTQENSELREHIELTIKKAYRLLETAKVDFESEDYDSSVSRAYYAVFHMMEGALILKGLSYSKHSAVIANFNLYFIKEGIFPKEYSKQISILFEQRQLGDYDVEPSMDEQKASESINTARQIVKEIESFIIKELEK